MHIRSLFSVLCLVLFFGTSSGNVITPGRTRNILVLFSYAPGTPAYRVILDGIREKLTEEYGDEYNLHMEYLETERYPAGKYPQERFDLYNKKYKEVRIDLLVCVGVGIVPVVRQCADNYLLHLPTITVEYDFSGLGIRTDLSLNARTTVIAVKLDPLETIHSALTLFPATKYLYVISGVSNSDKMYLGVTRKALEKLRKPVKCIYFYDISMDEVLHKVHKLPVNSLIFIPGFSTDSKLVPYYNPEATRLISKSANAPVFTVSDMGFGDGSVGGYIISFQKIGVLAGEASVRILNGVNPTSIKVTDEEIFDHILDWRELKRWHIEDSDRLPENSKILFKETSFVSRYWFSLTLAVLFVVLQTLLIFRLIIMNRQQKLMAVKLKETDNMYRALIHEDRILRMGQMAATLAHELNQPLTAILSTAQAGLRYINSGNDDKDIMKEILQNIVEDDKRTAAILNSIRGMLKRENREKEKLVMNSLINELTAVYKSEAITHKITLDVSLLNEPACIIADKIQIQQVLLNLITNADQSINKINAENRVIEIDQSLCGNDVIITVSDRGEGIDEALITNIFKPFVTSKKEGFGVGLTICRAIIEDHRGRIWAKNRAGGGAQFSFSLPISQGIV